MTCKGYYDTLIALDLSGSWLLDVVRSGDDHTFLMLYCGEQMYLLQSNHKKFTLLAWLCGKDIDCCPFMYDADGAAAFRDTPNCGELDKEWVLHHCGVDECFDCKKLQVCRYAIHDN